MSLLEQLRAELSQAQLDGIASSLATIPLVFEIELDHATEISWDVLPDEPEFTSDLKPCHARIEVLANDTDGDLDRKACALLSRCRAIADHPRLVGILEEALGEGPGPEDPAVDEALNFGAPLMRANRRTIG